MASSDAALQAALDKVIANAVAAEERIVRRGQALAEAAIKKQFTTAHSAGQPGSKLGSPPAVVTGTLRRSVMSEEPVLSAGVVSGRTFPTTVYARILELGGDTGRNQATHIDARPYVAPAAKQVQAALESVASEEWGRITVF